MFSSVETRAMVMALDEARKGGKLVFPNPRVGAVIIDGSGRTVAVGHHECCGGPHAERNALAKAGDVSGMTMVVTLEPCSHHGRTPPCVEAICESGISRVIVGMVDPDPRVSGAGIRYLRERGIEVGTGLLEDEVRELNRLYLHHRSTGRSLVHLKMAGTLDGRSAAADGTSRWITGEESRTLVHSMRRNAHAVLIGAGTAIADDPSLTVRMVNCDPDSQPARIIFTNRSLPENLRLFTEEGRTIVACDDPVAVPDGVEIWTGIGSPGELLRKTADSGLGIVFCEGGKTLAASLLRERLVDRLSIFTAPVLLGEGGFPLLGELGIKTIGSALRLTGVSVERTGDDILTEGEVVYRVD